MAIRGDAFQRQITSGKMERALKKHIRVCLKKHGKYVSEKLSEAITSGRRSGRIYGTHRASAPGERPASKSGRLASSFLYKSGSEDLIVANNAKSKQGAPYPLFLEEGTSKMLPRPYFVKTNKRHFTLLKRNLRSFRWT